MAYFRSGRGRSYGRGRYAPRSYGRGYGGYRRSYPGRSRWARPRGWVRRTPALVIEQAPDYGRVIPKAFKARRRG